MNHLTPSTLTEETSPEQRVAIAVLTQAIAEAKAGDPQARAYVSHANQGFNEWCDRAGLDADWLRKQIRVALDGHGPRVRTSKVWGRP